MRPPTSLYRASIRAALLATALIVVARRPVAAQEPASLSGVVRDSSGHPVTDAEVGVLGAGMRVRTDAAGAYRITNLLAGRATVVARRLGFASESHAVRLASGESRQVDFVLAVAVQTLDATAVVAKREAYDARLAGFTARSKQQVGHFVTRERIDRANSATLVDVLREIPGMRIGGQGTAGRLVRIRSSTCPPLVFIDGVPASAGEFDLDMIDVKTVEGIEVYAGLGSLPPEFSGPRDLDRCGVIAIWSRPAHARERRRDAAVEAPLVVTTAAAGGAAFTRDEVDVPARPDSGTLAPSYPDSLFRSGVTGRVVVEFVVDSTGRVEPESVDVLEGTHSGFADAVRAALSRAHFQPAVLAGRHVRQVLQLPFAFTLRRGEGASLPPGSSGE